MTLSVGVLGSSGSIGTQTLAVIAASNGEYRASVLAVHSSVELLLRQVSEFQPDVVVVVDEVAAKQVANELPPYVELLVGDSGLAHAATLADVCVNAVVGFAGLPVTLAAIAANKRLGLANKESLIAGGPVVRTMRAAHPQSELLPIDSEHAAIHQCLRSGADREVAKLLLTASGGPFRGRTAVELANVTLTEALAHPTWTMGPKITIDSSTLMNKGLEVLEAHELFDVAFDRIKVVVHPQSIVHSMVEFTDASVIAQLSSPDMRLPISYALSYPDRGAVPYGTLDWTQNRELTFEAPDRETFPCLDLAYEAGRLGGGAPAWLNAANEVAVAAFLKNLISWPGITQVVAETLEAYEVMMVTTVDDVLHVDKAARRVANQIVKTKEHG